MGYPLFGIAHLLCVAVTILMVAALIFVFRRLEDKKQKRFLKVIPIFMVFLEVFKDLFILSVHRFSIGYLQLLCDTHYLLVLLRQLQ